MFVQRMEVFDFLRLASTTKQHSLHSKQQLAPPTQRLGKLHAAVHF
tara:strand:- start:5479 stop:5616 length:138 start_codon:yes stop_codon:yes gene_type:complete